MKFKITNINKEFELKENICNLIVLENTITYRNIITELINNPKHSETIIFYENTKIHDTQSIAEFISNIIYIDINKSTILKKIYKSLEKDAKSNYVNDVLKLKQTINDFLFTLSDDFDTNISDEFHLTKIFESVDLAINYDKFDIIDNICKYMDIVNKLENKSVFIFTGLRMIINQHELIRVYSYANQKKYSIIMLEQVLLFDKLDDEDLFILDSDLCEIY